MPDRDLEVADAIMRILTLITRRGSRELSTTALLTLAFLADEGPQRITDLALAQRIAQPSMTVLVANLEQAGYVERRRDPGDGRVTLACLTPVGERYIAGQRREGAAMIAGLIAALPSEQRAALGAALPALVALAGRQPAET